MEKLMLIDRTLFGLGMMLIAYLILLVTFFAAMKKRNKVIKELLCELEKTINVSDKLLQQNEMLISKSEMDNIVIEALMGHIEEHDGCEAHCDKTTCCKSKPQQKPKAKKTEKPKKNK